MLKVYGNAKINLTLDILGSRADGFHEVAMVMQQIALHDTLELEKADKISLAINVPWLKADESNLAWRAASLIQEKYQTGGVKIKLAKEIPVAAGLAGGSADAAAVLKGMNKLYGLNLTMKELCNFGAELGSDIPFCLMGGTMLATGRGEILEKLNDLPKTWLVLAKSPVAVSTAWAYKNYDEQGAPFHPDNEKVRQEIASGNIKAVAKLLCNVLESVTIKKYGIIADYKQMMLSAGAVSSMMSGSGPTVFAIAKDKETAEKIADYMRKNTKANVFVTHTLN